MCKRSLYNGVLHEMGQYEPTSRGHDKSIALDT
jgi:hypothetical protein